MQLFGWQLLNSMSSLMNFALMLVFVAVQGVSLSFCLSLYITQPALFYILIVTSIGALKNTLLEKNKNKIQSYISKTNFFDN